MNAFLLILTTISSSLISLFFIYQYVKNSGSKIDYLKASEFFQNGSYDEAEIFYKISLKKTKSSDYVHLSSLMGLQNIYFNSGRLQESLQCLDKAIEISEKNNKWKQINSQLKKIRQKHFS